MTPQTLNTPRVDLPDSTSAIVGLVWSKLERFYVLGSVQGGLRDTPCLFGERVIVLQELKMDQRTQKFLF